MTSNSSNSRTSRSFLRLAPFAGPLAVALFLVAGASAAADSSADDKVSFAPGWEQHTKPLIFHGIRRDGGTWWLVPATLPKGTYLVITRAEGAPRLVDGHRFTVTSDVFREINLAIDSGSPAPEAIDERWVVMPGAKPAAR